VKREKIGQEDGQLMALSTFHLELFTYFSWTLNNALRPQATAAGREAIAEAVFFVC
jgi:hypothetical protein